MDMKELLDDLHKDINEERENNPKMAEKLEKRIEDYNRQWYEENTDSEVKEDAKGLEYEIIKQYPNYAEILENALIDCYEEGLLKEDIEEEKDEPERIITNVEAWVLELSNYYVDKSKNLIKK